MDVEAVGFLACGWALPSDRTHGTCIALSDGHETVLIDAGGQAAKGLANTFGLGSLSRVYLTHEHPDHTWGLPGLVHALRFAGERGSLEIVGPPTAIARARGGVEALGVEVPFELIWRTIPVEIGGDELATWAPMDHSVPCLAYRIGDVVVCGDTRPCDAVVDLAEGASLLVHEATHTDEERVHGSGHATPSDAGAVAARADVDTLAVIHVHPSLAVEAAGQGTGFPSTITPVDGDVARHRGATWVLER